MDTFLAVIFIISCFILVGRHFSKTQESGSLNETRFGANIKKTIGSMDDIQIQLLQRGTQQFVRLEIESDGVPLNLNLTVHEAQTLISTLEKTLQRIRA